LAAGLGERLRPITYHIPKPLLPILGKPVLQSLLENVSTLPVNKIGINLHHKKEIIENWINKSAFSKTVKLFPEEPIRGTGGALKNAQAFLGRSTFLVHNADILTDIDLAKLLESHVSSKNLVTLAVHDYPEFNSLAVDERGFLKGIVKIQAKKQKLAFTPLESSGRTPFLTGFTGIAVYEPEFLKFLPTGTGTSSVVDGWAKAQSAGYKVGTLDVSGCCWSNIGTPSAYASTVFNALKVDGEIVYIHPSVDGCKHVGLDGYVVIEKESVLNCRVTLKNCILLPGSRIGIKDNKNNPPIPPLLKSNRLDPEGGEGRFLIENCIIGPGFKIDLRESEMLGLSGNNALLIGIGGSDRKYYRERKDKNTAVLMQCVDSAPDYQNHIEYTRFFLKHFIPVPELIEIDPDKMMAVFEDLGDISLYSWLKCPREQEQIKNIYRQVIDVLILIHTVATKYVSECPLLQNRVFDYEHFRWETGYFIERFVEGIRNIRIKDSSALNEEFHRLALKVDSFPKTIIHRDFQSQNIMIVKGEIPRLIDYQGARIGPPAYDLVSILWDPYYRLDSDMREYLVNYYINEMINRVGEKFREKDFRKTLLLCRLQRHMQALGAYGFLSAVKEKKYFLKYVPEGLRLLKEDISLSKDEYPVLYDLVIGL
jgi:NDP-sugar pyrophosphorylase family protein/aminoglycoside/choline kinase family phosphotransferase